MVDPISSDDIPPFSPNSIPSEGKRKEGAALGQELYSVASSLYSWYEWFRNPTQSDEGFHHLQVIMQIAHKGALSPDEEKVALEGLKKLCEELHEVVITIDQIPHALTTILNGLIDNNSKARVIKHATEIEIKLRGMNVKGELATWNQKLETLMDRISTNYTPMEAEGVSRQLHTILQLESPEEMTSSLQREIFPLLDKR